MSHKYYGQLDADSFIGALATEPMELSWEKQREQLIMWKKAAREWLNINYPVLGQANVETKDDF